MARTRSLFLLAALLGGPLLPISALAAGYSTLDLGAYAISAINKSGQMAGTYQANGANYLFLTGANGHGVTNLGSFGANLVLPTHINATGQVVGYFALANGNYNSFITGPDGHGIANLGSLGGGYTLAYGMNDSGQVVGQSSRADGTLVAFATGPNGLNMTALDSLNGSYAIAINNEGQVLGVSPVGNSGFHSFLLNAKGVTELGTLGGQNSNAQNTYASAMNAFGQVTGKADLANGGEDAFLTGPEGKGITDLGNLGGSGSVGVGINDYGQVVGFAYWNDSNSFTGSVQQAFVTGRNGKGMTNLNSLVTLKDGAYLTLASGINNGGQIVATGSDFHVYLLTPSP